MATSAVLLFALLGVVSAAPPHRQRRQTTITAEVMPIAEDHFDEGRTVHACHVMPNDGSEPKLAVRAPHLNHDCNPANSNRAPPPHTQREREIDSRPAPPAHRAGEAQ